MVNYSQILKYTLTVLCVGPMWGRYIKLSVRVSDQIIMADIIYPAAGHRVMISNVVYPATGFPVKELVPAYPAAG